MAYVNLNFVPGEILTAAKMNLLAANDASFHDGTGIGDGSIQPQSLSLDFRDYSTNESNTGKKWIDDKYIYRKTFSGNIIAGAGTRHSQTFNEDVDNVIACGGYFCEDSANTLKVAIPGVRMDGNASITGFSSVMKTPDGIFFATRSPSPRNGAKFELWVEYTKSS
jgi:hypothetical protein